MPNGATSKSSKSSFHFVAGLGSGVVSAILLQPADLLKTRIQQRGSAHTSLTATIRELAASPQPIKQFWRGTTPSAVRTGCGSALYFGGLNVLRSYVATNSQKGTDNSSSSSSSNKVGGGSSSSLPKLSNTANLLTGAVARTSAGFAMMPVTVLKVRYESSLYAYTSLLAASRDIFRTEGLRGFFAGFGATAVRDAPYAGLYVLFYEQSKKRLSALSSAVGIDEREKASSSSSSSSLPPLAGAQAPPPPPPSSANTARLSTSTAAGINFLSGIFAAVAGTALTNPFDAIKTRLQLQPSRYGNMLLAARRMLRDEGVRSMFDGLGLRIGRKAMSSALAWTLYEELIRRAEIRWERTALL